MLGILDDAERIDREIAGLIDRNGQDIGIGAGRNPHDRDVANAVSPLDVNIVRRQRGAGEWIDEMHEQGALPLCLRGRIAIEHFQEVDAVERLALELMTAKLVAAEELHTVPPRENSAVCLV